MARSVLLVAADEELRRITKDLLELEGFEVRTARSGSDATMLMGKRIARVVVIDD
jgi:DNA-binding NtrC family response regulator